jgi:toxin FitB
VAWNSARDIGEIAVSVMTLGEIRQGIELLPHGQRRDSLWDWLEHSIPEQFANRVLETDVTVAQAWGVLSARAIREKRSLPTIDGILLATAEVHGLAVVTRNVRDFSGYDVPIVNPWDAGSI